MEELKIIKQVGEIFEERFGKKPLIVRSPGRVNIIGEHTDYNEGFVLPAAIDRAIFVAIGNRNDDTIHLYSKEFDEEHVVKISALKKSEKGWANYILGVVDQIIKKGISIPGFNLVLDGNVPVGAGLSSSAAIECATGFALNEIFELNILKEDLVKMAQKAEHEYAGVMVGIMDMFASVFGKKDHVLKLDCRSLDFEYVPLKLEGIKIVLFNTNVKHSLASSEYNNRRKECEAGVALVKEHHPQINSLRDVSLEMLEQYVEPNNKLIYKRCKYVVEENLRLLGGCEDLKNGHIEELGKKMFATHDGLSAEYEVSCKELDFLVDFVRDNPAVLGARMMGGGFGGCTINLVKEEAIEGLIEEISKAYKDHMQLDLSTYVAETDNGTSIVSQG